LSTVSGVVERSVSLTMQYRSSSRTASAITPLRSS